MKAALSFGHCRLSLAFILTCLTGCTSHLLKSSTVAVNATLPTIWEAQFLDNLGRFIDDSYTLPAVLVLHTGQIRVTSQVSPAYKLPYQFADPTKRSREADLGGQFTWDEQWSVVPVTATADLKALGDFFRTQLDGAHRETNRCSWSTEALRPWLCVDPADRAQTDQVK
jgi:hypothetical protein